MLTVLVQNVYFEEIYYFNEENFAISSFMHSALHTDPSYEKTWFSGEFIGTRRDLKSAVELISAPRPD